MSQVAKLFLNGRSQAVRLPSAFRFDANEVYIRKDAETGDVILSRKPADWDGFFSAIKNLDVPEDFLTEREKPQVADNRDPFAGWVE
ncbi:MAG: type II toxin-antitoxin system VapB family antitoxin [Methylophilaceae bacterium]